MANLVVLTESIASAVLVFLLPSSVDCGCSYDLSDEVVNELKRRMKNRGDTGKIIRVEKALKELEDIRGEVLNLKNNTERIMLALNLTVDVPVEGATMDRL